MSQPLRPDKTRLTLDSIAAGHRKRLESRLPPNYPLDQYLSDLLQLDECIEQTLRRGFQYLEERDFGLAGTVFTDASDLDEIYDALTAGDLRAARRMMYDLDTAVRDHIPTRLYEQIV